MVQPSFLRDGFFVEIGVTGLVFFFLETLVGVTAL
jgi:hypothetical protein